MNVMNVTLKFRDAKVSEPIVECLEQNFAVTRVDAWVRIETDDVRKIDALRRFGRRHGFDVMDEKVAA